MIQYPDTEAYMINYPGGAYGSFITGIISMLLGIIPENTQIEFSEYGNAHAFSGSVFSNYSRNNVDVDFNLMYDSIEPADPYKPLILASHMFPIWDDLFYYYPKCKNIIITIQQADLAKQSGNLFFKTVIDSYYDEQNPNGKTAWEDLKNSRSDFFKKWNINVPEDLTPVITRLLLERYLFINNSFYEKNLPTIDMPNIFYLPMSDIIHNRNKTLLTLAQITNSKITPRIVETYNNFLRIQEELVRTKMPWVTF